MVKAMDWLRRLEGERAKYLRFARARLASDADAEDVLQRAFLRAVARAGTLEDAARAEAWFFRILRRAITDHHRTGAVERGRASDADVDATPSAEAGEPACHCSHALLASLAPAHAEILKRVDAEGEAIDAVARSLGITAGNAYVRLHRARRSLRAQIEHRCGVRNAREAMSCACDGC
jgi:RNA polymerase sigma-70 factor (ECF subfamily)